MGLKFQFSLWWHRMTLTKFINPILRRSANTSQEEPELKKASLHAKGDPTSRKWAQAKKTGIHPSWWNLESLSSWSGTNVSNPHCVKFSSLSFWILSKQLRLARLFNYIRLLWGIFCSAPKIWHNGIRQFSTPQVFMVTFLMPISKPKKTSQWELDVGQ